MRSPIFSTICGSIEKIPNSVVPIKRTIDHDQAGFEAVELLGVICAYNLQPADGLRLISSSGVCSEVSVLLQLGHSSLATAPASGAAETSVRAAVPGES